ncbi:MAG: RNA 2',3'-cyclic phosphodiesterase [Spirochaetaceae bacterium]|nr:RNA 2',3'-cyclic phosphodiesterase [Spirochaetaceae bacterium]
MRCFVSLDLPSGALADLARAAESLRPLWPGLSWTRPPGYHLTLAFLGEIEGAQVEEARGAVRGMSGSKAIPFEFAGLGRFPSRGNPRVLIVQMTDQGRSAAFASALGLRLRAALNWVPEKSFTPHVTVARIGPRAGRVDMGGAALARAEAAVDRAAVDRMAPGALRRAWTLSRCALYKSELRPGGAVYTEIEGIDLDGAQAGDRPAGVV